MYACVHVHMHDYPAFRKSIGAAVEWLERQGAVAITGMSTRSHAL